MVFCDATTTSPYTVIYTAKNIIDWADTTTYSDCYKTSTPISYKIIRNTDCTTSCTTSVNLYTYTGVALRCENYPTCFEWVPLYVQPKTPAEKLREIIATRQSPKIIVNHHIKPMPINSDIREQRARETLKRVIGEKKYKNFLRTGFVSVKGKSGQIYQIFPGHGITCVYENGNMIERLCVVLKGDFPPTDSLIMRYLLILNNEKHFRSFAVKHNAINKPDVPVMKTEKSLTEIFAEIKEGKIAESRDVLRMVA